MRNSQIILGGEVLRPIFTSQQALLREFVHGRDEQGPYVACRLKNRNPSKAYGWYIFVSPEDLPPMQEFKWYGNISNSGSKDANLEIRRRHHIDGKDISIMLGREIWRRMHAGEIPRFVYRLGHPLDFRRMNLSEFPSGEMRGITKHKDGWQVQISVGGGESLYVGRATSPDEGYRMFNRALRELKAQLPNDAKIQAMPYNKVEPEF